MSDLDLAPFAEAKSDQLVADDLIGGERTITITRVAGDEDTKKVSIYFEGDGGKPFRPCKTVIRVLMKLWGKYASEYVGRSLTLYRDPEVEFGGIVCGGIRVSHASHIDSDVSVILQKTRGKKSKIVVHPLKAAPRQTGADYSAQLEHLKALARPGNKDALGAKWQEIGPEARKALAAELPALKAACEAPADDVPFDAGPTLGDQLADTPAEKKAAEIKALLDAATDAAAVEQVIAGAKPHMSFLDDDLQMELERAFDRARQRFAEPVK